MNRFGVFAALATIAACRPGSPPMQEPSPTVEMTRAPEIDRQPNTASSVVPRSTSCATTKDAEGADILRVSRKEDGLALYAHGEVGLVIVDVSDPDRPAALFTSRFVGTPIGVFDVEGAALVVYAPANRPESTVVRAVSLQRRTLGAPLGELTLAGTARDAWRVDDTLVVVRDAGPSTVLTAFVVDDGTLATRDEVAVPGNGAAIGASPWGVAVARSIEGTERTAVTWVAAPGAGILEVRGTAGFSGAFPRWRRSTDHAIDVTEDNQVRVIGCATTGCTPGESATYSSIDFSEPLSPRLTAWSLLARSATAAVAFTGSRLFVARPPAESVDATEVAVFLTERELTAQGSLRVEGTVASMIPRDDSLVTLGWTGTSTERRAMIHLLATRHWPKRLGSVSFGGDWTWSPAFDDDRAISFDPGSTLAALPMTAIRQSAHARGAVQVLSFEEAGPHAVAEHQGAVDRVLFVGGRLLAFTPEGITVVASPGAARARRTWTEMDLH